MSTTILEKPDFCLPAEFLTDEDILMHNKQNFLKNKPPNNFEEQLVELTRQLSLQKSYHGCYSPRSPGSSSDGSPTSHFASTRNSLDLIYQAASQVSNLKINAVNVPLENSSALYNSFFERARGEQILNYRQQRSVWSNNQLKNCPIFQPRQNNGFSGVNVGGYLVNDQTACPLQYEMQQNLLKKSYVFPNGGSGKPSAGTGVFLPRRYENNRGGIQTQTNKIIGYSTGERITAAASGGCCVQPQWQPRRGDELHFDYEIQLAQKNATMLMHQRSHRLHQEVVLGHEVGLPQEWTY